MSSTRTRVLGTTRIEEPIGKGGMAQVYRGKQRSLGRSVAVKVMLPSIARDKDNAQRFRREARTLAALHHENIVAVHDLVEKNGQIFMLLEYVEGTDVGELLRSGARDGMAAPVEARSAGAGGAGPSRSGATDGNSEGKALPLDVALIIATGVARALEHAHFRRIIHRDIKPANVMISRRGEVKLADFGIAKELGDADLTQTGFVVGTPSYLAPELLKGNRADHRADLYAVGVLLYQCLTGKKPFSHKDPRELFAAILAGKREKVRALAPSCPRAVEKIVDRCLEGDLGARYARTADLRRDLEEQLNAVVNGNPSARLVGFLFAQGQASADDLATVDVGELASVDPTLDLSMVDLTAARASLASIEIDLDTAPIEEDSAAPEPGAKRWRHALAAAIVLVVLGGLITYALAPAETAAALQRALSALTGSTSAAE